MDTSTATSLFNALSQDSRLDAFRLLVKAGPEGLAAGAISERLAVPHNTLSFHLRHLAEAGLVRHEKRGRSVMYFANYNTMRDLIEYLVRDCCSEGMATITPDEQSGCSVIELSDAYCTLTCNQKQV